MALILIVDDESAVRRVLSRWLQGAGHEVLEADSAATALNVLENHAVAVVFSDVQMPGRDGLWLTAEVRKRYRTTAVILATSVSSVAPEVSMQVGVMAYLVKPFTRAATIRALETALTWHVDTVATGPRQEDTNERLEHWLAVLEQT